jgi:undecaprenyl-diphosphatase
VRIIRGFLTSLLRGLRERRMTIQGRDERLAWMIVLATIPVGLTGVALDHTFRTLFAKPAAAAVFLFVNGLVLLGAELLRRAKPAAVRAPARRARGSRRRWRTGRPRQATGRPGAGRHPRG